MKHIWDWIQARFSQRNMSQALICSFCLNTLKKEFQQEEITGYIKFSTLFITTKDQKLRIEIYRKKRATLNTINKKLVNLWINNKIKDIIFK